LNWEWLTSTEMIHSETSSKAHPSAFPLPLLFPIILISFQLSSVALIRNLHPTSFLPFGNANTLGLGASKIASFEYVNDKSKAGDTPVEDDVAVVGLWKGNQAAILFRKSEALDRTVRISAISESCERIERDKISVRAAETVHSPRDVSSDVEKVDKEGEKAEGAASRKVAKRRG
jgi:hypothetical protein